METFFPVFLTKKETIAGQFVMTTKKQNNVIDREGIFLFGAINHKRFDFKFYDKENRRQEFNALFCRCHQQFSLYLLKLFRTLADFYLTKRWITEEKSKLPVPSQFISILLTKRFI